MLSGSVGWTLLTTPYHIPGMTELPSFLIHLYPALLQTLQLAVTGVVLAGCSRFLYALISSFQDGK